MPPSCALLGGFAVGARVALLWQHYGNAWQSPAVIHQAHRTPHAYRTRTLCTPAKTPLAGDKIDAPAACAVPFRPYCEGVVTRTRNVSEYMLVLALCLVYYLFIYRREWLERLTGSYCSDFVLRHKHVLFVLLLNCICFFLGRTVND